MKTLLRALCAGLFIPFFPARAAVTYQDIVSAATNSEDLSRQALITIFGEVVTDPLSGGGSTLIGNMFGLFNGIIAIMAIVWFMFIGLRHIVKTGHQGQVFDSGRDIVGTLSTVGGFLMVVPTGNGWGLAQLIMLWGVSIMGVGSANLMVNLAADNIASGYSMTVQPVHTSTRAAARGIFEMQLCKHAINTSLKEFNQSAKSATELMAEKSKTSGGNYTVTVSNGSGICGTASIPVNGDGTTSQSAIGLFFNPFSKDEYAGVITAQRKAMEAMIKDLDSVAGTFVTGFLDKQKTGNGTLPDIETRIQKAANTYETTVQNALPVDNNEQAKQEALKSYLKTYGWAALGAWYQTFATANQRLTELADRAPSTTGISSLGEMGDTDLFAAVMEGYTTQLQNTNYTPPLGSAVSTEAGRVVDAKDPSSLLMKSVSLGGVRLTNFIATEITGTGTSSNQVNPLIKMKNIGDYTMGAAESIWVTYTLGRVVTSGGVGSLWGKLIDLATGAGSALEKSLDAISPVMHFLLFLMFTTGFSLSIYLPFIPFIFWMTGIGNWIVSVLIGCTAGPLWGATHLGASQDRGSRAAYGYIYLIDTMIRPPLMVFGFFFASVAVVAAGTILHALFGAALVNVQVNSITGIFSVVGFLMVYARICTTLVAGVFALQAYLPDNVINFLGGRDAANTLGSMASSVKDIIIAGNRNTRATPGIREQRGNTPEAGNQNKDGIKN